MPSSRQAHSRRSALDLDEIAPNRFLVHSQHVKALLKGEGVIAGPMFELTTWRRQGLLARLRDRGFAVRTLVDRIAALPAPPPPPPIGDAGWRALGSPVEHFSWFDPERVNWRPAELEARDGVAGVRLRDGWVLRRRKGRGASSYYLAFRERAGGIGMRPLGEAEAILAGYAQAQARDGRPWLVERGHASDGASGHGLLLPDVLLPPSFREVLQLLARETAEGWLVDQQAWPLAQALFERLGVRLSLAE